MLSSTLSLRKTLGSWGKYPTPLRARTCMGSRVKSSSPKVTLPPSGRTNPTTA